MREVKIIMFLIKLYIMYQGDEVGYIQPRRQLTPERSEGCYDAVKNRPPHPRGQYTIFCQPQIQVLT